MTDSLLLDAGQDPGTQAAIVAAQAIGARDFMAFSGGRSLFFPPWSKTTVQGLMANGLGVLPVYAMDTPLTQAQGFGDGQTAAAEWQDWGIPPGSLGMLDVEPDFFNFNPVGCLTYANAWQAAVQQAGYLSCMYGLANFIDAFQSTPPSADAVIVANYPLPKQLWGPPSTDSIPGALATWPTQRGWQYTNEVTLGTVTCDVSVINFTLGGDPDMTPDQDATLTACRTALADIWNLLTSGHTGVEYGHGDLPLAVPAATVDVNALAAALAPHLPPATDPAVVATDVVAALRAQFDKP